jgi:hypothetical protein
VRQAACLMEKWTGSLGTWAQLWLCCLRHGEVMEELFSAWRSSSLHGPPRPHAYLCPGLWQLLILTAPHTICIPGLVPQRLFYLPSTLQNRLSSTSLPVRKPRH